MRDFLRDPIWQFIGVLVAIIGILVTLIALANTLIAGFVFIVALFALAILLFYPKLFFLSDNKITSASSVSVKENTTEIIIPDAFQKQKLQEQKLQDQRLQEQELARIEQENKQKRKKKRRLYFLTASGILSILCLAVLIFLELSPQVHFFASDNDYGSRVTSIAWSPNGALVAFTTQDGSVRIWNVAKRSVNLIYSGVQNQNMYDTVTQAYNNVAWSPNGMYIAFGNNDNKIRVANVTNPQKSQLIYLDGGNSQVVNTVVWSPDGEYIAFGGDSTRVYIKKVNNSSAFVTYTNSAPITALAWARNGKSIASGGTDGKVHTWSVSTGKDFFQTANYSGIVTSLAWSPTSPSLLASASSDSRVDIWDISKSYTDNPVVPYEEKHAGKVNGVAWSPNGEEIVSVGDEGSIRIWDAKTGDDLSVYQDYLHPNYSNTYVTVTAVGWSSDGKSIAIGHSEDDKNHAYNNFYTVKVVKFCRSLCLLQ